MCILSQKEVRFVYRFLIVPVGPYGYFFQQKFPSNNITSSKTNLNIHFLFMNVDNLYNMPPARLESRPLPIPPLSNEFIFHTNKVTEQFSSFQLTTSATTYLQRQELPDRISKTNQSGINDAQNDVPITLLLPFGHGQYT